MKIDTEGMKKKAIDEWNKKHPDSQFIDTSEFILETETKKTKKDLLKEIYDLKIENEVQKSKSYNEGFEQLLELVTDTIKKEKFILVNANLALHKEEDYIIDRVEELIAYANHYKEHSDKAVELYNGRLMDVVNQSRRADNYKGVLKDIIISEYKDLEEYNKQKEK